MESHSTKPLDSYFPPLNSLDSSKTLTSSPPNLSHNLSPWSDSLPDSELSDYDSVLEETEVDDTDIEEKELTNSAPICCISSHWSQPWSNINDHKPAELPLIASDAEETKAPLFDCSLRPDSNAKPSFMSLLSGFKAFAGAGLLNLGNTCFLNAVMQCFTHTVPLLLRLFSVKHKFPCVAHKFERFCVLCALLEHVDLSLRCMGDVVGPWTLVNSLNYFSSGFWKYQQEDAHEFLQCFLDKLENCLKDISSQSINMVTQVFGGCLLSRLRCCNCGHCSDTYEPSIDLSLEIEDTDTLNGALDSFTKVEKLEDSEMKFTCENCKEQVCVEKQMMLDQTPAVAILHLKRFKNDGCFVEKIDKHVAFPLELDLHRYTDGRPSAELKYDLYAVVVHIGFSSNSGHYYCFIRSAPHIWYKFDDEQVDLVEEELVLSQEAYILFYAKQEFPCFTGFIEAQHHSMDITVLNTSPKSVFDNVDASTSSSSLPSECQTAGHETNDAADEASTVTTEKAEGSRNDDYDNEENFFPVSTPLAVSNSSMASSCNTSESQIQSILKENKSGNVPQLSNLANDSPRMPRSPSPEIYREDPPDQPFSIPPGHLGSADQVSRTRQLRKGLEDVEREEACALVKKSMSGTRGKQLLAAIGGSPPSEGFVNKKRSRGLQFLPSTQARNSRHKGISRSTAASLR